jgi:hypothetical protein
MFEPGLYPLLVGEIMKRSKQGQARPLGRSGPTVGRENTLEPRLDLMRKLPGQSSRWYLIVFI